MGQGDIENGVEHLSLAVLVCNQPQLLIDNLKKDLNPKSFSLLLQNLDLTQKKIGKIAEENKEHVPDKTSSMLDMEVETKSEKDPVIEKKTEDEKVLFHEIKLKK